MHHVTSRVPAATTATVDQNCLTKSRKIADTTLVDSLGVGELIVQIQASPMPQPETEEPSVLPVLAFRPRGNGTEGWESKTGGPGPAFRNNW